MLGRAATASGFGALLAATANGFLLPPDVNTLDSPLGNAVESGKSQTVRIPCSACAFSTKQAHADGVDVDDEVFQIEGGANDILLNFTTSDDNRRLEINGATIYPALAWSKENIVIVHQVPASGGDVKIPLQVTSSGLMMDYEQPYVDSEAAGSGLVRLRYGIMGLEKHLMQLQGIKIDLLKTGDELLILKVEPDADDEPAPPTHFRPHFAGTPPHGPPAEMMGEAECNMLPAPVCRFKHMLEAKIAGARHGERPCPSHRGMGPRPHAHFGPPPHHERPQGHHRGPPHHRGPWQGHRHGHHHHHHHHFAGAFVRGFIAVLVPVVAGISVGLTVSLLGLVMGRFVSFLWMRYARKESATPAGRDESVEEGKGLMLADEDEPLPAYEDAPAYEESEEKISY